MRQYPLLLAALLLCLTLTVSAQQSRKSEKHKYVIVPPESLQLAVASQPDCPVQLENARLLLDTETNELHYSFDVRNHGPKPVAVTVVDEWHTAGGGGTARIWEARNGHPLLPGRVIKVTEEDNRQIIPLTDELRDKLRLRGGLRRVHVLYVPQVIFADGSKYDAAKASEVLGMFLGGLSACDDEGVAKSPERPK